MLPIPIKTTGHQTYDYQADEIFVHEVPPPLNTPETSTTFRVPHDRGQFDDGERRRIAEQVPRGGGVAILGLCVVTTL